MESSLFKKLIIFLTIIEILVFIFLTSISFNLLSKSNNIINLLGIILILIEIGYFMFFSKIIKINIITKIQTILKNKKQ